MKFPLLVPDRSKIVSQISIAQQEIAVFYDELTEYFEWTQRQTGTNLIKKAAELTLRTLSQDLDPKQGLDQWETLQARGLQTLGNCIRQKAITCLHIGLFFHLLLQQKNIPSILIQGYYIESNQNPWTTPRERAVVLNPHSILKKEEFKSDGHLWNVVHW
ncbi:MAG TPA: hypothetical protein VJG90_07735 [Candidatus Nanoarchaeia archaeon]|nr:hypothetical protein [Candidatus Nanoarchaeia archaeon]